MKIKLVIFDAGVVLTGGYPMKYLAKRFNVKPNEVIYIDDQEDNLSDAKKLGIHTILYKDFKQFKKEFFNI